MKCPKCGFNSFEFLDACKKCGAEFTSFKQVHGISPVILRPGTTPEASAAPAPAPAEPPPPTEEAAAEDQGFSWEESEETPVIPAGEGPDGTFDFSTPDSAQDEPAGDNPFAEFSFAEPAESENADFQSSFGQPAAEEFTFDEPAPAPEPARDSAPEIDAFGTMIEPESLSGDEFSFEEPTTETEPAVDTASGMDSYETMIEPESLSAEVEREGSGVLNEFEFAGTSDLASTVAEPATPAIEEDFFTFEETPRPEAEKEKKPAADLDDFDREFKEIFAFDEATEDPEKK